MEKVFIEMTAAKKAKKIAGLKLIEVSNIVGVNVVTLDNWSKARPALFKIILLGCAVFVLTKNFNEEENSDDES